MCGRNKRRSAVTLNKILHFLCNRQVHLFDLFLVVFGNPRIISTPHLPREEKGLQAVIYLQALGSSSQQPCSSLFDFFPSNVFIAFRVFAVPTLPAPHGRTLLCTKGQSYLPIHAPTSRLYYSSERLQREYTHFYFLLPSALLLSLCLCLLWLSVCPAL